MEVVSTFKDGVYCSQNTYPRTSMNPEQNKHHSGSNAMHIIDLNVNDQIDCDNRLKVNGEPFHD